MKLLFTLMFTLAFSFTYGNTFKDIIDFRLIDYSHALEKAANERKLIFVNYNKDEIAPCELMRNTTFKNREVVQLLNGTFINVDANIDTEVGKSWKNKFNIECLPTYMVFDYEGRLQGMTQGSLTTPQFLDWLNAISAVKTYSKRIEQESDLKFISLEDETASSSLVAENSKQEIQIISLDSEGGYDTSFDPSETSAVETPFERVPIPSKLSNKKEYINGVNTLYAIQLGAFKKYSNAQALLSTSQTSIPGNYYIVEEKANNDTTLFKVLKGSYTLQEEAENELVHILNQGIDCFLRKL